MITIKKLNRIIKIITVCAMVLGIVVFIAIAIPILIVLAIPFFGYGTYLLMNETDRLNEIGKDRTK